VSERRIQKCTTVFQPGLRRRAPIPPDRQPEQGVAEAKRSAVFGVEVDHRRDSQVKMSRLRIRAVWPGRPGQDLDLLKSQVDIDLMGSSGPAVLPVPIRFAPSRGLVALGGNEGGGLRPEVVPAKPTPWRSEPFPGVGRRASGASVDVGLPPFRHCRREHVVRGRRLLVGGAAYFALLVGRTRRSECSSVKETTPQTGVVRSVGRGVVQKRPSRHESLPVIGTHPHTEWRARLTAQDYGQLGAEGLPDVAVRAVVESLLRRARRLTKTAKPKVTKVLTRPL
jgi:hypothetical protein